MKNGARRPHIRNASRCACKGLRAGHMKNGVRRPHILPRTAASMQASVVASTGR